MYNLYTYEKQERDKEKSEQELLKQKKYILKKKSNLNNFNLIK